jgi:lipid-A-disaccharide synthase
MSEKMISRVGAKRVLIVAGEASGDLHGANLVEAIHRLAPEVRFYGIGGENLKKTETELLIHHSQIAVVGITEVLTKLRSISRAFRRVKRTLDKENLDLAILIDFPDFNLRVATHLKKRGIPVLYYISPQIWAWREWRIHRIKRLVDRMVVILPFECDFYRVRGVDVDFVGHPLLDIVKPRLSRGAVLGRLGVDPKRQIVGLFPGSRDHEVRRLLPIMLDAGLLMVRRLGDLHFLVSVAPDIDRQEVQQLMKGHDLPADIVEDTPYDAMAASELVIVASGTVTLEAAILNTPMVILYRVSPLTYWIGRIMAKVNYIGLVNLVAAGRLVPELIQENASAERIAHEALSILIDKDRSSTMKSGLAGVKAKLGTPGASERTARLALEMMNRTWS